MLSAATFSFLLIGILGAPLFSFTDTTIRLLFSCLWLNAVCTAYWYLKAIKQYLDTTEETQPGLTTALKVCIGIFTLNLAVHLIAGDAFI